MKNLCLLICLFIFSNLAFSQSETMPVILISTNKSISYKDQSKVKVIPGSIMNKQGTLTIPPQGIATLYHNYMFVEVNHNESPVELNKLFENNEGMVSKYELSFGEKISNAVYNASISGVKMKNKKSLVSGWGDKAGSGKDGWGDKAGSGKDGWGDKAGSGKDGWGDKAGSGKDGWGDKAGSGKDGWGDKAGSGKDGWGDKAGSGKDGWGDKDIKIRSKCPGGKYVSGINTVSWEALKGTKNYNFVIEDMDHNIVFTTQVKGTEYSIDTKVANLMLNKTYAWYVHHPTEKEVSTPVFFQVVEKSIEEKALNDITSLEIYKKANAELMLLMVAHQLEETGLILAAQSKYKNAMKVAPKNSLAKMMYSLFCINLNEVESAAKALK